MNLDQVFALFDQARRLSGHTEYVVIGSLSVLGTSEDTEPPADMTLSIDVDSYTRADPNRIFDLQGAIGEDSAFHAQHGYFLDPVSPSLPSLPEGWERRLMPVERQGLRVAFLDPNDAALSKYARGEPRDQRWIRAGIIAGLVSLPTVRTRFKTTTFLDDEEQQRARGLIDADTEWFEGVKRGRTGGAARKR